MGESPDTDENSKSKFSWTCDSCGLQWDDEGVVEVDGVVLEAYQSR